MSTHTDENEDLSQEEEDNHDVYQQDDDEGDYDEQQQNAFVTDDADVQLSNEQQLGDFEDIEPIEARPPNEIDVDEQERHQSGTPAFRTLDDV
jgi:hypothetical protein